MLPQLLAFREVAERRSFRAAAQALNLSQPALTLRIKTLESHLGFRLFDREKSGNSLTPEGERFLPYARSAIQAVRDGTAEARRARGFSAVYRIMSTYVAVRMFVLDWMRQINVAWPDIAVSLDCGYPDRAARLFSSGLIDAAVTYERIEMPGLRSETLFRDDLVLVTSCENVEDWRDHYTFVNWDEPFVEQHRLLLPTEMDNARTSIHFVDALVLWAMKGPATGYAARRTVAPYLRDGTLKIVPDAPVFERSLYLTSLSRPADVGAHAAAVSALHHVLGPDLD